MFVIWNELGESHYISLRRKKRDHQANPPERVNHKVFGDRITERKRNKLKFVKETERSSQQIWEESDSGLKSD